MMSLYTFGGILDLYVKFSDLNSFVTLLNDTKSWKELWADPIMEDSFYDACSRYLVSYANRFPLFRCITIRLFFSRVQRCLKSPIKVKIHPFRQGYGYMLDRGEVHILSDLLFRSTHGRFISVLLHETAHIVLSRSESYDKLLQLDLLFAETYLKDQHNELLKTITPVEFFTQQLADHWMEKLVDRIPDSKRKAPISGEISMMQEKLLSAIDTLNKIYANTKI